MSKKPILNQGEMAQTLVNLANEIIKAHPDKSQRKSLVLLGIHRRGVPLARRLKAIIEKKLNHKIPLGTLDITLYRDDLDTIGRLPIVKRTDITFDLTGKNVILVDDVLFTGRTVRAALNELADFGRPRRIQLAVLIDRGLRELPIEASYVGKYVKSTPAEIVMVKLQEIDGADEVIITAKNNK